MKFRYVFWPILLIAIGLIFILHNFGILDIGWRMLWSLWPLILIFWGIAVLPMKDIFKIIAVLLVLAFTVIFFNRLTDQSPWGCFIDRSSCHRDWGSANTDEDETTYEYQEQNLSVPFDSMIRKGILRLDAAAGNFSVGGVTGDFLTFHKKGDIGDYSLTTDDQNGTRTIRLSLEKGNIRHSIKQNKVDISLSDKSRWDLDFDVGAAEMDLDLSSYHVDTMTLNAGASSIEIKLGDKSPAAHISLNAGASSLKIKIPEAVGCEIRSESFMISREFKGFDKKGDRTYQTPGFDQASRKIYIEVKTAVSKIKVTRY
jgi:hypothetical protein